MHNQKEFRDIFDAMRNQGWTLTKTSRGHWKCLSPHSGTQPVFMSDSGDHRAVKNTIRDLTKNGLIWPDPPKVRTPLTSIGLAIDGDAIAKVAAAINRQELEAADVVVESGVVVKNRGDGEQPQPLALTDEDAAYKELKDARAFFALADQDFDKARAEVERAQAAFKEANELRLRAAADLRAKKNAFDEAFAAAEDTAA